MRGAFTRTWLGVFRQEHDEKVEVGDGGPQTAIRLDREGERRLIGNAHEPDKASSLGGTDMERDVLNRNHRRLVLAVQQRDTKPVLICLMKDGHADAGMRV